MDGNTFMGMRANLDDDGNIKSVEPASISEFLVTQFVPERRAQSGPRLVDWKRDREIRFVIQDRDYFVLGGVVPVAKSFRLRNIEKAYCGLLSARLVARVSSLRRRFANSSPFFDQDFPRG